MFGPILSVMLMGVVPVWGGGGLTLRPADMPIAPPAVEVSGSLPVLTIPGNMSASGVLILDLKSGQTLYQRSAQVQRPMASLTKLMTALLIIENHELDAWAKVPADAISMPGSSARLGKGEEYTVGDLLSGLLIPSGNDAAVTLAAFHSGSTEAFVEEMNERAAELGLKGTRFVNPTGLDATQQVSTPRDMTWLALYLWNRYPEIAKRMRTPTAQLRSRSGKTVNIMHTHTLLHSVNPVIAGKTGTTDGAGQCLLSVVEQGTRQYLVVIMHSSDRYRDMRAILSALAG